ncbi:3-hydroxyacyl-ACP dehydratase [Herbaspirillum sp. HC18]|nr:3-hydroxyacyl-ACP dehydratase [Herbaspirillum sp. HC18]
MSLLPQILEVEKEAESVRVHLFVSSELDYFSGHFPGLPILPGVVQVDWAIRFARQHFVIPGVFIGMKALKFTAPVQPDTRAVLELRWNGVTGRLDFTYQCQAKRYSAGQVLFAEVRA